MAVLFVPKEMGDTRVAAVPDTVRRLVKLGFTVLIQSGAGVDAGITDARFVDAGATIVPDTASLAEADVVAQINPPSLAQVKQMKAGALLISLLWPKTNPDLLQALIAQKVTVFAMDQIPRISRAQSMDALSSQANIGGYKASLIAADMLPRLMPLMMTAAGTITPARFVVMGAGVAGLQAVATARRLGAVVEVSDVRSVVKEQVESIGARFIEVEGAEDFEGAGGYAKEASADFLQRQREEVARRVAVSDAVITTALIPGRTAPKLVTKEMVESMRPGSVIVDLAAEQGGNCELTKLGEVVEHNGVKIIGYKNLSGMVPFHASDVYAKNVQNVLLLLFPKGELNLDFEDEIIAGSIVAHEGAAWSPDMAAGGAK